MGARAAQDWDRAQIHGKRANNRGLVNNDFKMGDEVFTVDQGGPQRTWREEDGTTLSAMRAPWWPEWQLPVLLSLLALIGGIGFSVVILVWLKNQMSSNSPSNEKEELANGDQASSGHSEGGQWIYHPVIRPMTTESLPSTSSLEKQQSMGCRGTLPEVMTAKHGEGEEKRQEPVRIKAKGLLERRGSSASLTIDLLHPSQENLSVTPTRECTAEEYLLSVGNVLSRKQLRACLRDVRALHREFWDLPLNHPEKLIVPGSGSKNRYRTIIPNEATRVHLPENSAVGVDTLTGYINANYIKGYDGEEKAFIATQGPLPHTVVDFWIMIWEENAPVIVMFTKLWEKSRSKCEPYFPTDLNSSVVHGEVTVAVTSIQSKDGYTVRHFDLMKGDECRHTVHFWFDSWPDHKTPANAHSLLCLAKEVEIARFLGPLQRRNSPSTWSKGNESPGVFHKDYKPHFLTPHSAEVSPNQESDISPPSLKEVSPILNFGRLEFKDDTENETDVEHHKESKPESSMAVNVSNLISLIDKPSSKSDQSSRTEFASCSSPGVGIKESEQTVFSDISRQSVPTKDIVRPFLGSCTSSPEVSKQEQKSIEIKQHSRYSDSFTRDGKKPFKFGSLPHDSPKYYPDLDMDSVRSKSVENPPTWIEPSKDFNLSEVQKDKFEGFPVDIFNFGNLTISPMPFESSEDKSKVSENVNEMKFTGSRFRLPSASDNIEPAGTRLSVDSPSWATELQGGQGSSFGSPACSDIAPWLQSKSWMYSSSAWNPLLEGRGDSTPLSGSRLNSPSWFDRSPVSGREGSLSGLLWGDVPRGTSVGPVVVHCSAGIGRTGCFIAISIGINQLLGENNVDVLGIVCRMRYDRGGMVQTAEQYEFIHRALALFERSLPDQSGE